jgi:hypothetical protein
MTHTDADLSDNLGRQLRAASSRFGPSTGLAQRVAQRQRQHQRRQTGFHAGLIGLAATVAIGGLVWVQHERETTTPRSNQPTTSSSALAPSPTPNRIDAYPVITWPAEPSPVIHATHIKLDEDLGWRGAIGIPRPGEAPTTIIAVEVFPAAYEPFLAGLKGRIAGVFEETTWDGSTSLTTTANGFTVVVTGDDVDLLYEIVATVEPVVSDDQLDGYTFDSALPAGLVELEPPQHRMAMTFPAMSVGDGLFGVRIEQGAALSVLGGRDVATITVNGRHGYRSISGPPTVAIAVSTDETLYLTSTIVDIEQLMEIAQRVTLVDESTWVALYDPYWPGLGS